MDHKTPNSGQEPNSWESPPLLEIAIIFLPLVWNYSVHKNQLSHVLVLLSFSKIVGILPMECVSLWKTLLLLFCGLLLNSFLNKAKESDLADWSMDSHSSMDVIFHFLVTFSLPFPSLCPLPPCAPLFSLRTLGDYFHSSSFRCWCIPRVSPNIHDKSPRERKKKMLWLWESIPSMPFFE